MNILSLSAATPHSLASQNKEEGVLQGILLGKQVPKFRSKRGCGAADGSESQNREDGAEQQQIQNTAKVPHPATDSPADWEGR